MSKRTVLSIVLVFSCCFFSAVSTSGADLVFEKPFGMCFDDQDNLYVADITRNCITVLDKDFNLKGTITEIKGYGELLKPFDVDFHNDRFYILDNGHNNVVVADENWQLIYKIGAGQTGSAPGEFSDPHCIAVSDDGVLFVTDTPNHRIQKFDSDGKFLGSIKTVLIGGDFPIKVPTGIATIPGSQNIVVAEYGGHPPVIAEADGNILKKLKTFGSAYIAYVDKDRIYIVSTYNNTVAVHSVEGDFLFRIHSRLDSSAKGQLNKPAGVIADRNGNIIVAEWRNQRLQKFSPEGKFIASWGDKDISNQCIDFPKVPRRDATKPVILSAFTRVLSPATVKKYHSFGITKLYIQPVDDLFNPNVKAAVDAAHSLGMTIEVVFDVYQYGVREVPSRNTADKKSEFANQHPEFHTLKRDGTRNRRMLSYFYPEVRKFKVDAVVKAVKLSGADAVALDYLRWPAGESDGYDPPAIEDFTRIHGVSPLDISPTDIRWIKYRGDILTTWLCELRSALSELDRYVEISVFANAESEQKTTGRDWSKWARMGVIDRIAPMIYTDDYKLLYDSVKLCRTNSDQKTGRKIDVASCIDCYCGYLYTNQLMREGAWVSLLGGADEVSVVRDGTIERLNLFGSFTQITQDFAREACNEFIKVRQSKGKIITDQ